MKIDYKTKIQEKILKIRIINKSIISIKAMEESKTSIQQPLFNNSSE